MCVCIYIGVCVYIYICQYIDVCVCVDVYICLYIRMCIFVYEYLVFMIVMFISVSCLMCRFFVHMNLCQRTTKYKKSFSKTLAPIPGLIADLILSIWKREKIYFWLLFFLFSQDSLLSEIIDEESEEKPLSVAERISHLETRISVSTSGCATPKSPRSRYVFILMPTTLLSYEAGYLLANIQCFCLFGYFLPQIDKIKKKEFWQISILFSVEDNVDSKN